MKKLSALNFFLAVLMVFSVAIPATAAGSLIADPNLERVIKETLELGEGEELTQEKLADLTYLYAQESDIDSLAGLEYSPNLYDLYISNNNISDLTPLKDLQNLEYLSLWGNNISDLSPLKGNQNLRYINVSYNLLSDLSPLANSPLWALEAHYNDIKDISVVKSLPNVNYLLLSENEISDLSPLSGLKREWLELDFTDNNISDLSALKDVSVTGYAYLNFSNNKISNLTPLNNISTITRLSASGNEISSLKGLNNLTKIDQLDLSDNKISSLEGLNLSVSEHAYGTFNFSGNNIKTVGELSKIVSAEVDLRNNDISDLTPLKNMKSGALYLTGNPLNADSLKLIEELKKRGVYVEYNETVTRVSGSTRYDTAAQISQQGWETADTVIIVRGDDFPDALAGAPLAYQYDAPILMSAKDSLGTATTNEIKRLGARNAIILGGTGVLSDNVKSELTKLGLDTRRIGGKNRYETSKLIAEELNPTDTAVVAFGRNFPDALAVASYAAVMGYPILLTEKESLPTETSAVLDDMSNTIVVGGTGAVSDKVYKQLPGADRVSGATRYETAAKIISKFDESGIPVEKAFIANGRGFADALTGSVLAAKQGAPLLLVEQSYVPAETSTAISDSKISEFTILGGKNAVSDAIYNELK